MVLSRHRTFLSLLFYRLASADVSCGGHSAPTCTDCPYDNDGNDMGEGWCNGDCNWANEECVASADVSCGGHSAPTCTDCPYDNDGNDMGEGWCNGDCNWANEECVADVVTCGNGAVAQSCAQCPAGESGCGTTGCAWHTSTQLCRDALSNDVRTASVHLRYPAPLERPAWWFQRVIPTASASATYFSSNGHAFGYGGIQELDRATGRVLFSLWDQGGCDRDVDSCDDEDLAKTVACGEGVVCTGFGGEGTGRKSSYDRGPFQIDDSYYFVTQAAYIGNRRMEYTGYFYEDGRWRLLSRIQVSTNASEQWWMKGLYSFVEQWTAIETTSNRAALFGPSYMADTDGDNFLQVRKASFSHGTLENHQHVNAWQVGAAGKHAVGIETGGDVQPEVQRGEVFTYPESAPYEELTSFQKSIGCLNKAYGKEEIEACLDTPETPCVDLNKAKCIKTEGCIYVKKPKKVIKCSNRKEKTAPKYDCPSLSSKKDCLGLRNGKDKKVCKMKRVVNPNLGCRPADQMPSKIKVSRPSKE